MRAVSAVNTEHSPRLAVPRVFRTAKCTVAAARIYLANDALSEQIAPFPSLLDYAYELVPKRPFEAGIAFRDLKIRVADA